MESFTLDIHGLVRTRVVRPAAVLGGRLRQDMGTYLAPPSGSAPADVTVTPWEGAARPALRSVIGGNTFRFAQIEEEGEPGIGTLDRRRLTAAIFPGREVRVAYDPQAGSVGRIYGLLLTAVRLALHRRGASLLHAACLSDGRRTFLLVGARGSGKTRLVLALLNRGWSYLGDDKVLLAQGRVYPFEPWIGIRDWHVDALPWLAERLPPWARARKSQFRRNVRRAMRAWGDRHMPKRLATPWRERFNPAVNLRVAELFAHVPQPSFARPDALVHLWPGRATKAHPLSPREAVRRTSLLQRIGAQDWYPLPDLLALAAGSSLAAHEPALLETQLPADAVGLELETGDDADADTLGTALADAVDVRDAPSAADQGSLQ